VGEAGGDPNTSRGAALGTVLCVLFLTFLDTTIVSVALGDLENEVSAGVIPLQWVINAYALVFASLMLLGGTLGDRFGRRRVMLVGMVIFAVGSVMCALAGGVAMVIAGRGVMGVGAAASEPGTLSVIRQLYPDRALRARALGAWSAVSGLALALGPVIGGLLVGAGSWRNVFWFNLALTVLLVAAVARWVPESRDAQPGRLDFAGFVLGTAGLGCLIYAAIAGEYKGYGTGWVIALFVIGGLSLIAFVRVELRVAHPMLNLSYVRKPIVSSALFAAFAVYFSVFAIFFFTALYLDIALQYSGVKLAGMFAPMAAAIVFGGLFTGRWVARAGSRGPMVTGCAVAAVGMLLARHEIGEGPGLTFGLLALALALAGLGFGITVVPLTSAVLSHVPSRHSGMAASATNTARQLGAVFGVAALGAVINAHLIDGVHEFVHQFPGAKSLKNIALKILETGGHADSFDINNLPASVKSTVFPAFLDGVRLSLVVALVLVVLAGLIAAFVREPEPVDDEPEADIVAAAEPARAGSGRGYPEARARGRRPRPGPQPTSTGSTDDGSAPPSTASNGSA
jgi:EmrB/QacA subfamily drug resistance transporter